MKKKTKILQQLEDEEKGLIAYRENENPDSVKYYNDRINVLDDLKSNELGTWKKIKDYMLGLYSPQSLFFVSHKEDEITGKPQLIYENKQNIVISTRTKKKIRGNYEVETFKYNYKFPDDVIDKRDREQRDEFISFWFYVYKIVEDNKEYYILSQNKLIPDLYRFRGMKIICDDNSELSKTFKFGSLTTIFISVEEVKAIKTLNKKDLIEHIKKLKIKENQFVDYLFTREDNNIYSHTDNYSKLIISFLLSWKYEGYPLHLFILGRAGTGKTYTIEAINNKFKESSGWFACELSTLKGLIPSYRDKPAKIGYILDCVRIGLIDELFKMIEKEYNSFKDSGILKNYLGGLNSLLEHKEASAGTGNDSIRVKSTAKLLFMANPYKDKKNIYEHIEMIGDTTLSRMIPLTQTKEERDFVMKKNIKINKNKLITSDDFKTIYDSCNNFLIDYDDKKVREIDKKILTLIKNPLMRENVWESRGLHHSILLLDGIVKFRCLFDEKDRTFRAKKQDYEALEKLLIYIIESWDCSLRDWKQGDSF